MQVRDVEGDLTAGLDGGVGSAVGSGVDDVTGGYFPSVSTLTTAPVGGTTARLLGTHQAGPPGLLDVETLLSTPPGRSDPWHPLLANPSAVPLRFTAGVEPTVGGRALLAPIERSAL